MFMSLEMAIFIDLMVVYIYLGGGGGLDSGVAVDTPVAVEETIQAEGAAQVESGFGFSMPGLSVSCFPLQRSLSCQIF